MHMIGNHTSVFINKAVLEHSHTRSLVSSPRLSRPRWQLSAATETVCSEKPRTLTIWSSTEFAEPLSTLCSTGIKTYLYTEEK